MSQEERERGKPGTRPHSDRWWENYLLRYFVGTVVGVLVIVALRESPGVGANLDHIVPDLQALTSGKAAIIGALGFAYCYVASTPVLAMHAARGGLDYSTRDAWTLTWQIAGGCALFALVVVFIHPSSGVSQAFRGWTIIAIVFLLQVGLLVKATKNGFERMDKFYEGLVEARKRDWLENGDFTDSYRHLREHGNAVLIVILEILLGLALWFIEEKEQLIAALIVWLSPAASTWFLGSVLEARFSARRGDLARSLPLTTESLSGNPTGSESQG